MIFRILLSFITLVGMGIFHSIWNMVNMTVVPRVAGLQFDNSDTAYAISQTTINVTQYINYIETGVVFVLFCLIWLPFFYKKALAASKYVMIFALLIPTMFAFVPNKANAYYDQKDWTEIEFILPNESAFWIPDVGANKDSQVKFNSQEYFEQNKIAAKRFQIPHATLPGTSYWSNYYVPTGRLIIIDRTPFYREWVAASHRGTSQRDESFPCQSSEGLDVTVEVAVAASVTEENAAKFLYFFGVLPPEGDRSKPEVIFQSIYHGRSLTQIMDTVGRGEIQTLVCKELSARTLDQDNTKAGEIMDSVKKNATEYLASKGITLDYIGWAGTFTFEKKVQDAINEKFATEKLASVMPTLKEKAVIDTAEKWDGHLPSTFSGLYLIPGDILNAIISWFSGSKPTVAH
jgi:hypothetical protein